MDQPNGFHCWFPLVHWIIGSNQQSNPMVQPNGSNQWINPRVQPNLCIFVCASPSPPQAPLFDCCPQSRGRPQRRTDPPPRIGWRLKTVLGLGAEPTTPSSGASVIPSGNRPKGAAGGPGFTSNRHTPAGGVRRVRIKQDMIVGINLSPRAMTKAIRLQVDPGLRGLADPPAG